MLTQILIHTPRWVFGLFFILLGLGYQQSKTRTVNRFLAFFFPLGMIVLSYLGVLSSFGLYLLPTSMWLLGVFLSAFIGVQYFPLKGAYYQAQEQKYCISGSWRPLLVMMAIYFTKYMVGILTGLQFTIVHNSNFVLIMSFIYGGYSGYFVARAISLYLIGQTKKSLQVA